jgi:hypothetical protein
LLDICHILLTFIHEMKNGQNFWQLSLRSLPKLSGKVRKYV